MYGNGYYMPQQRFQQPMMAQPQQYVPPMTQPQPQQLGLQGKVVESIEVVKAMDIPLDGSTSYFVISDGTAIVTKQLQNDGTSKTVIYKPVESNEDVPKYVTFEDMKKALSSLEISELDDFKDELKEIKKQIKEIKNNSK